MGDHTSMPAKREAAPVAVTEGSRGFAMESLEQAWRFAEGLIRGKMVPKSLVEGGAGAVVGIIQAGKEIGLPPMFALSNMTFTNGRIGLMGDAACAVIRARGGLKPDTDFEVVYTGAELTPEWTCTVTCHPARSAEPASYSFSLREAMLAGLVRIEKGRLEAAGRQGWNTFGPWATYPKRMLYYRALGFLVRDKFSHLLSGAVLVEELRDWPEPARASVTLRDAAPPAEPDPLLELGAGVEELPQRQETGSEDAMPPLAPTASAPAAADNDAGPEIDPETGEEIPAWVGQAEPAADGFEHAGTVAQEIVAGLQVVDLPPGEGPFDASPAELAQERARSGEAPETLDATPIGDAERRHIIKVLSGRGRKDPAGALRYIGTLLGRSIATTQGMARHDYERLMRALGEPVPLAGQQAALL